jgi:hypothetical protein
MVVVVVVVAAVMATVVVIVLAMWEVKVVAAVALLLGNVHKVGCRTSDVLKIDCVYNLKLNGYPTRRSKAWRPNDVVRIIGYLVDMSTTGRNVSVRCMLLIADENKACGPNGVVWASSYIMCWLEQTYHNDNVKQE